jgi:hypothetical protein
VSSRLKAAKVDLYWTILLSQMFLYFGTYINDKFYSSNFRLTNLIPVETKCVAGFNIRMFTQLLLQQNAHFYY